jgi:predicted metal-dependent phosphoesterase TrpH
VIDLHMHTTASDGRSTPEALVGEAVAAGCRTIAVTDHDTVAGLEAARAAATRAGLGFVDGIEITAVVAERDVHILGYFIDPRAERLNAFLATQRERRRERFVRIAAKLSSVGAPVDVEDLLASAAPGKSFGRPALAQALIRAGHARDVADAFDRFLSEGRPGYVVREGESPAVVVDEIRAAGGLASIAHPGKLGRDALVEEIVASGIDAVEVFHPDHDTADRARYQQLASRFGVLVTGGSDYHGPGSGRTDGLGVVSLPAPAFDALVARAPERPR